MTSEKCKINEIRGIYIGVDRDCRVAIDCPCNYCKDQAKDQGIDYKIEYVPASEKLAELADNNINQIIIDVPPEIYFENMLPFKEPLSTWKINPLEEVLTLAHKRGIGVNIILSGCFYEFEPFIKETAVSKGWGMVNADGERVPYGDPGNSELKDLYIKGTTNLARKYDIDGISLDFIRYPEMEITGDCCYCDTCRSNFKKKYGFDPMDIKIAGMDAGVRERSLVCGQYLWDKERESNVTSFVRDVASSVRSARKSVKISAYVWGMASFKLVFQNWSAWIDDGSLDWINPSGYDYDLNSYKRRCIEISTVIDGRCPSCITIGHHTTHGRVKNVQELINQIQIAAQTGVGANGFVLFTHSHKDLSKYLPEIAKIKLSGAF